MVFGSDGAIIAGIVVLIIAVLIIMIAMINKREKPKLMRIDRKADYSYFLTFRGMEEEVRDFSKIERVLTAFDEGREAWSLKIVPPIGTLSEWKGYYDDREKTYVMEIFFIREDGIQKWRRRCDYDGLVQLNRNDLKNIIVKKRQADFYFFYRVENNKKSAKDKSDNRVKQESCPDLSAYRKMILLHNITCDEVNALLKEYEEIYSEEKRIPCDFYYTAVPDDPLWICLVFPDFEKTPHNDNFWNYQNLMIWFSQNSDMEFCFAFSKNRNKPLFLSMPDYDNPAGDSCIGICANRPFHFAVPENIFKLGTATESTYDCEGFLEYRFGFDVKRIFEIRESEFQKTRIMLGISK